MTHADDRRAAPKANILLVDDQPANLLTLEAVLADLGQNLVRAQSGEEALRRLLTDDFAVVLLDVQMQGLHGFETARLIRGRDRSRHTPIIFITAYESSAFPVVEAYRLGAVDYLVKPLVAEILRAKVSGFVELFQKTEQVKRQAEQLRQWERQEFERQSLAERARLAALNADVSASLANSANERAMLQRCVQALVRQLDAAFARIWTLDPEGKVLELQASAGMYTHLDGAHSRVPVGQLKIGLIAQERQPHLTNAVADDPRINDRDWAKCEGMVAFAGYPLLVEGRVVGVMALFARRPIAESTFHGLASVADGIAQCIERKRAEEALRVSRERLDLVIRSTGLGLWYSDLPFNKLVWNDKCKEHFGLPPDADVTIELFYERLHPDDRERARQAIERSIAERNGCDLEYRTMSTEGHVRWMHTLGRGFYDEFGKPIRFDGITVDVTDQKRVEEALQEADRRKDEFLAMLAHELRNPLAPILHSLHILRLAGADNQAVEHARNVMDRQIHHLTRLVDDLLDVSRIARGKVQLRPERLDLAQLARTTSEDRRRTLEQAGLALAVDVPQTPVWITGDATRLTQVLNNLFDNAAKFTDRGGSVTVRVTASKESERVRAWESGSAPAPIPGCASTLSLSHSPTQRGEAVLSVRDTGIGIEPEMLLRLFDVFAQADRSLDRTRGGLGLGLAVVKGLVDSHGGEVTAASAGPGRGAEFTVRLPLEEEPAALSEAPPAPQAACPRLRILIVEDNRDAAESLRMLLELLGHDVAVAYSGPEGVRAANACRPDVILCDIGLPGLDGYGVVYQLRRNPATAQARIIAVTGYGQESERRRSQEAGFDYHLTKPVDPDALQKLFVLPGPVAR